MPTSIAITTDTALEDKDLVQTLFKTNFCARSLRWYWLCTCSLKIKRQAVKHYLYIRSLPATFDMLPYYWTLNDFMPCAARHLLLWRFSRFACSLSPTPTSIKNCLEKSFASRKIKAFWPTKHFYSTIFGGQSRVSCPSKPLPSNALGPITNTLALIPIFEMLNHKPGSSTASYVQATKWPL